MGNLKKTIKTVFTFFKRADNDHVTVYAAQASFFMILSAIPFLMMLMSLVFYFLPITAQDVMRSLQEFLPMQIRQSVLNIVGEIFNKSSMISLFSITAITTIWSASRGIVGLEMGLNSVFHYDDNRNYFITRAIAVVYTLGFIIATFGVLVLLVFGNKLEGVLIRHFGFLEQLIVTIMNTRVLIAFVFLTLFFTLIYKILPGKTLRFRYLIPGAVCAAAGWLVFSYLYAFYIDHYSNYSYVYGSLGAIILMMLWIYNCMIILLYGAELNAILIEHKKRKQIDTKAV